MIQELAPLSYEDILAQLCEKNYAVIDQFIPLKEGISLLNLLQSRKLDGLFKPAAIGKAQDKSIEQSIRSDQVLWLNANDSNEAISSWFRRIRLLSDAIRKGLFIPINDFECHFAHYPSGTFYKKHLDAFKDSDERLVSIIGYLNPDWKIGDGGELLIYDNKPTIAPHKQSVIDTIEPMMGRVVLMLSKEVPHEVALSKTDRYSITGWLRYNQPI
jgi:SM-20-related protein